MRRLNCKSKSEALTEEICSLIVRRNLDQDSLLPSEGQLERMFSLSRITIRRALDNLVSQEIVYKRKGSGTYVLSTDRAREVCRQNDPDRSPVDLANGLRLGFIFCEKENEEINDTFHFDINIGASMAAGELNCQLDFIVFNEKSREEKIKQTLEARNLDGVISGRPLRGLFDLVEDLELPLVNYGSGFSTKFDSVSDDNECGGLLMTRYLRSLGHEKIVFVDYKSFDSRYKGRRDGFLKVFEQTDGNAPYDRVWTYRGPDSLNDRIIQEKPTAIFAAGDSLALEISRSIWKLGLKIPEDISVAGYDNRPSVIAAYPGLTTIACSRRELGAEAVHMLKRRINNPNTSIRSLLLKPELMIRESCGGNK